MNASEKIESGPQSSLSRDKQQYAAQAQRQAAGEQGKAPGGQRRQHSRSPLQHWQRILLQSCRNWQISPSREVLPVEEFTTMKKKLLDLSSFFFTLRFSIQNQIHHSPCGSQVIRSDRRGCVFRGLSFHFFHEIFKGIHELIRAFFLGYMPACTQHNHLCTRNLLG